jgi:riboflavin synthase
VGEGESIAVQGACLTVETAQSGQFTCAVLRETLDVTNLGRKHVGARLNLERALAAGARFGGHIVSGHVDGTGNVTRIEKTGNDWVLEVECDPSLLHATVLKGSIACDGVSLTVSALSGRAFQANIIPFTFHHTSLGDLTRGDRVNIETDIIGKYARSRPADGPHDTPRITEDILKRAGFLPDS